LANQRLADLQQQMKALEEMVQNKNKHLLAQQPHKND
jgi:hypothetical protein